MNFRFDYAELEKRLAKKTIKLNKELNTSLNFKTITSVANKKVVITGTIPGMTRNEVTALLKRHGTNVFSTILHGIDFLIVGKTNSVTIKIQEAEKIKIPILQYTQVKELK